MAEKDFVVGQNIIADNIDSNGVISSGFTTTSITTNSATTIATFDKTTAESAQFIVSAVQGSKINTRRVAVVHDGTTADMDSYVVTTTGGSAGGAAMPNSIAANFTTRLDANTGGYYLKRPAAVAYGGGKWVAVGGYNTQGNAWQSTDSITWAAAPYGEYYYAATCIAHAPTQDRWFAGGFGGYSRTFLTGNLNTNYGFYSAFYGYMYNFNPYYSRIRAVAVGQNSYQECFLVGRDSGYLQYENSSNMSQYSSAQQVYNYSGNTDIRAIAYGGGTWVVVEANGGAQYNTNAQYSGFNSSSWSATNSALGSGATLPLIYGGGKFVGGRSDGSFDVSTDGINWVTRAGQDGNTIKSLTYGNGLFVSGGSTGKTMTSTDAITWVSHNGYDTLNEGPEINGLAFGEDYFVGVGNKAGGAGGDGIDVMKSAGVGLTPADVIALTLSVDISGSDVRLRATVSDAATNSVTVKVIKPIF